jgi:hypothetical protein
MDSLESWARLQLSLVLRSTNRLAGGKWDEATLLQVVDYGDSAPHDGASDSFSGPIISFPGAMVSFSSAMISFVYLALSISAGNPLVSRKHFSSNLNTCARLFIDPSLTEGLPELFGCVFAIVLSLDRQSSVWKSELTRDHRAILYAAQVQLTRLDQHEKLKLGWLESPQKAASSRLCSPCERRVTPLWGASFGQLGALGSVVPLEDISTIIRLPQCRQILADAIQSEAEVCESQSQCGEELLRWVDQHIEDVFLELESEYRRIAE